ncbi:hypothetical protein NVS55_40095 (plasmid) [Myxococcus stipitatus]|uniref:hypothetical protein n=1 Tax=Myxococcus stipitatus TaxID=83455 RepID=UPI0031451509
MIRHPDVRVNTFPTDLCSGIRVRWFQPGSLTHEQSAAILFAGGDSSEPGWAVGVLQAPWRLFSAGTFVCTNASHELPYTWFVSGCPATLWAVSTGVHLRSFFGDALVTERRWPDWLLFSAFGPVHSYDRLELGHCSWSSLASFLRRYDFAEYPHCLSALESAAADVSVAP